MPPAMRCPHCHTWAPVDNWHADPPPPKVPFTYRCPHCNATSDVSDLDYTISPTESGRRHQDVT